MKEALNIGTDLWRSVGRNRCLDMLCFRRSLERRSQFLARNAEAATARC